MAEAWRLLRDATVGEWYEDRAQRLGEKVHRARVMEKMRAGSVAELVRLADEASVTVPKDLIRLDPQAKFLSTSVHPQRTSGERSIGAW
jgi:hypothetical protein